MTSPEQVPEKVALSRPKAEVSDREWAVQVAENQAALEAATVAVDSVQAEKAQAKMEAETELQALSEQVALDKVRLATDKARLNELSAWMNSDEAGNDAIQTGKNVAEMRALQTSVPESEATFAENELKLKQLEAQYRTRFPETLN